MKDQWYADKRDLVKWSVLCHLAKEFECKTVLQIAYYRPSTFESIYLDGKKKEIPRNILLHFRNLHNACDIKSNFEIEVFDKVLDQNREKYIRAAKSKLTGYQRNKLAVFLDPDTGLEPEKSKPKQEHVLESEAREIWDAIKPGDLFILYQHKDNRAGKPWVERKKKQLAKALRVDLRIMKVAKGSKTVNDVVFYYMQKKPNSNNYLCS